MSCWPTPSNDGTCLVNIEYELENDSLILHDVVISIPLPYVTVFLDPTVLIDAYTHRRFLPRPGSYPTVSSHTGDWSLNPSSHSLDWTIALITPSENSGSLEFTVGGDDPASFFPVRVSFVGQGSMAGLHVDVAKHVNSGEVLVFSQDAILTAEDYLLV